MSQPKWKCIANLGDESPIEYGGLFVFVDETGVYAPEAELLEPPCEDEAAPQVWTVYRFTLEPCTFENGILSDNPYYKDHPAWFAKPESERAERPQDTTYLADICSSMDMEAGELVRLFCSDDPLERAEAWRCVGEYHGYDDLDSYPLELSRNEVFGRYQSRIAMLRRRRKCSV